MDTAHRQIRYYSCRRFLLYVELCRVFVLFTHQSDAVFLVILSVMFENSGLMKNAPRQSQFEPTAGQIVKFSDVHGVDEVKDVGTKKLLSTLLVNNIVIIRSLKILWPSSRTRRCLLALVVNYRKVYF